MGIKRRTEVPQLTIIAKIPGSEKGLCTGWGQSGGRQRGRDGGSLSGGMYLALTSFRIGSTQ